MGSEEKQMLKIAMLTKNSNHVGEDFYTLSIKSGGNLLNFHIIVQNMTEFSIENIMIKCALPEKLSFHRFINGISGNCFYSSISNSIIWNIPIIKGKKHKRLDFSALIMPGITQGSTLEVKSRILEYGFNHTLVTNFNEVLTSSIKLYKV